jgi:hypothetical protein
MSGKLAYRLAVILMISPLIALPALYFYRQHQMHEAEEQVHARMEAWRAEIEARRLAHLKH